VVDEPTLRETDHPDIVESYVNETKNSAVVKYEMKLINERVGWIYPPL